ncbi:MAG: AMP-binding protein, partial [bacterium]|nr:AMP-binding protein [bacterium]
MTEFSKSNSLSAAFINNSEQRGSEEFLIAPNHHYAEFLDRPGIEDKDNFREVSRSVLAQSVHKLANHFLKSGIREGNSIVIIGESSAWLMVAQMAALEAGATVVHINPNDKERIIALQISDSKAKIAVAGSYFEVEKLSRITDKMHSFPTDRGVTTTSISLAQIVSVSDYRSWQVPPSNFISFSSIVNNRTLSSVPPSTAFHLRPENTAFIEYVPHEQLLLKAVRITHAERLESLSRNSRADLFTDSDLIFLGEKVFGKWTLELMDLALLGGANLIFPTPPDRKTPSNILEQDSFSSTLRKFSPQVTLVSDGFLKAAAEDIEIEKSDWYPKRIQVNIASTGSFISRPFQYFLRKEYFGSDAKTVLPAQGAENKGIEDAMTVFGYAPSMYNSS